MQIRYSLTINCGISGSALFAQWRERVDGWDIRHVTIHNVVLNGKGVPIIIQLSALLDGIDYAFTLRGATVDVLTILICEGRRFIAHVTQPRITIGKALTSNAAGFIEPGETPEGAAARERTEELAKLPHGTLVNLNLYTLGFSVPMVVSAGGDDEEVYFFAEEREVTLETLGAINRSRQGLATEGEATVVGVTPFEDSVLELLPSLGADGKPVDLKFTLSLLLYNLFLNGI